MIEIDKYNLAIERGFHANPDTGEIFGTSGKLIVNISGDGYIQCTIRKEGDRKQYHFLGHRFIWFVNSGKLPEGEIDHINHIRNDNRISNLRESSDLQNSQNGIRKGVNYCSWNNKWRARISVNYIRKHLGYFNTEEEAIKCYDVAKLIYHKF